MCNPDRIHIQRTENRESNYRGHSNPVDRRVEQANSIICVYYSTLLQYTFHKSLAKQISLQYIGPLNPAIHGIRVASVIAFSVLCLAVLCVFSVGYIFSNSTLV